MDKDIFEQLYRQHYAAALLYAQGLCRSRPLAEDMVQEAFCRAWLALPDGVVSFRSWMFRVLRLISFAHLSGAELAAARGVTPAVIRQRLRRARTRLRQKMEEDGYEF